MRSRGNTRGLRGPNALLSAITWISAAILLAACGGESPSAPSPHSASLSYPSSTLVFAAGTAISPVVPTASQGLSSFTVTPALPRGLTLNSSDGTLSGTPTVVAGAGIYTVAASGGGASATASLTITVNPAPPSSASYGAAALSFTTNIPARTLTPRVGGGTATSWSIHPSLPSGLTFDATTGTISGTPTTASAAASYVVTAQNPGGQATVTLKVEVDPAVLLDVGHQTGISTLRSSGSVVLSVDKAGHWNLWAYGTDAEIASGDLYCAPNCDQPTIPSHLADMANGVVVLATRTGFEFLSATGQVLSNVTASVSWWSLDPDGSYLAAGSSSGLYGWSPSGDSIFFRAGDYSKAIAFAAPGQVQIAEPGQQVIQTIVMPGGATSTIPYNGTFSSWFLDGGHFITTTASAVLVYSVAAGTLQATMGFSSTTTPFVGQGNWIWTVAGYGGPLQIFPVATSSAAAASLTIASAYGESPSGTSLAVATGDQTGFDVIDLSGSTPSETPYSNYNMSAYTALSISGWVLGTHSGVILDGASLGSTPRYFDFGAVSSIAGGSGSIAVATASGRIVYFDAGSLMQEGVISASASKLFMSSDGSILAAQQDDGAIGIYSLPTGALLHTWAPSSGALASATGLSASGSILAKTLTSTSGTSVILEADPATGGSPTFATTVVTSPQGVAAQIFVSPNGTFFATTAGVPDSSGNPGTDLWTDTSLTNAVTGYPIGWIDDGHLLVNSYSYPFPGAPVVQYAGCHVYSPLGAVTGPCALPEVSAFQAVTSDTIYAANLAQILSVGTGNVSWMSGDSTSLPNSGPTGAGAVAGSHVVLLSGTSVLAQGY